MQRFTASPFRNNQQPNSMANNLSSLMFPQNTHPLLTPPPPDSISNIGKGAIGSESSTGRGYNPYLDLADYDVDPNRIGFFGDIESITEDNTAFRKIIYTDDNMQIVAMALKEGEEIGLETHEVTSQFFRIESGEGILYMGDSDAIAYRPGSSFQVPNGTKHNVIAASVTKLYTIYSPPHHGYDVIDLTKEDANSRSS